MPPAAFLSNLPAAKLQQWIHSLADRRRAEEALRATQARLQHLLSASPAVIYSCKPSGNY
jgi:PAS domain-containing protein